MTRKRVSKAAAENNHPRGERAPLALLLFRMGWGANMQPLAEAALFITDDGCATLPTPARASQPNRSAAGRGAGPAQRADA